MTILIEQRFRGPERSGNGGYSAGAVAAALGLPLGPAEVTLRLPPLLDIPLPVFRSGDGLEVTHSGDLVAVARPCPTRPGRT